MQLIVELDDPTQRANARRVLDSIDDAETTQDDADVTPTPADDDPYGIVPTQEWCQTHVTSPAAARSIRAFLRAVDTEATLPVTFEPQVLSNRFRVLATDGRRPEIVSYVQSSGRALFRVDPEDSERYSRAELVGSEWARKNGYYVYIPLVDEESARQAHALLHDTLDA